MRSRRVRLLTLLTAVSAVLLAATAVATGAGGAVANETLATATATAGPPPTAVPSPTGTPTGSPAPSDPDCVDGCGVCVASDASTPVTQPVAYRQAPQGVSYAVKFRVDISYSIAPQIRLTTSLPVFNPGINIGRPTVGASTVGNPNGYEVYIDLCNFFKTCATPRFDPVYPTLAGYLSTIVPVTRYQPARKPTRFIATIQAASIAHSLLEPFEFSATCTT